MDEKNQADKQKIQIDGKLQHMMNINLAGGAMKVANSSVTGTMASAPGFDSHQVYGVQQQPSRSKVAQLPNVSQILSVSNENAQTVPMNGAQPLPPISTVAGGSCAPSFSNMGAYSGVGLSNVSNVALPIGVQFNEAEAKPNTETDPGALPIGVMSVPNVNFLPVHVGEMSLFTDANGSVCAAPSGYVPFHVPFSGIISIPSAVMAAPIDGSSTSTPGMSSVSTEHKVEANQVSQQHQAQYGVQLGNAQALFNGTQSHALFGTQVPFAAAFMSQPTIAFIGPSAMNMGGAVPNMNSLTIATQNGMPLTVVANQAGGQPSAAEASANTHFAGSAVNAVTQEQTSASNSMVDQPQGGMEGKKRNHRVGSHPGKFQDKMDKVAMRMSSLDEVFAQFTDTKPSLSTIEELEPINRQGRVNSKSAVVGNQPAHSQFASMQSNVVNKSQQMQLSSASETVKVPKKRGRPPLRRNATPADAATTSTSFDDEFMELVRSVVGNDKDKSDAPKSHRAIADASKLNTSSSVSPRAGARQKRPRLCLSDEERTALDNAFAQSARLSKKRAALIAARVGVPETAVIRYYTARRRRAKMERDSTTAPDAESVDPTAQKRRSLRAKTGPTTNYMSNLDNSFFDCVIGDEKAVIRRSRQQGQLQNPLSKNSGANASAKEEKLDITCTMDATAGLEAHPAHATALQEVRNSASQPPQSAEVSKGSGDSNMARMVKEPCSTDITALLASVLPSGADSPTDIVLPMIDTSLLPALDGGNILSAATAMLPTADELNLNMDITVCAPDALQQSG